MAWIESHQALLSHPKTLQLAATMGWDVDVTIGKLHRFWWWCVDYAPDGDLRRFNDVQLALAVGVATSDSGKLKGALVASCWIDKAPYFRVHDWWDYCGSFLKVKFKDKPERWKSVRDAYGITPSVTPPVTPGVTTPATPTTNLTNQPTAAHAREAERTMPPILDNGAFRTAWERWLVHWSSEYNRGRSMSIATADLHLGICLKFGSTKAIEAIDNAISRGLREPAEKFNPQSTKQPAVRNLTEIVIPPNEQPEFS